MIYFIVTTCLTNVGNFTVDDYHIRESQYKNSIPKLKQIIQNLNITDYMIIITENNGPRKTFLDSLGCEVLYTNNNYTTKHMGYKELHDVWSAIDAYKISDDDFIVKMTGRYLLEDDSEFMNVVSKLKESPYECVIRYGFWGKAAYSKIEDCYTGLIGMSCKYVKQIEDPDISVPVEWKWAAATYLIDDSKIYIVKTLGINICPNSLTYFLA